MRKIDARAELRRVGDLSDVRHVLAFKTFHIVVEGKHSEQSALQHQSYSPAW